MKTAIVSNVITKPLKKYLNLKEYDLDTVFQVLNSKIDEDILIILLDYRFFFLNFVDDGAYEKVLLLKEAVKTFRKNNRAKIILSNIAKSFTDINPALNIKEYQKLLEINGQINSIANEISDVAILNVFDIFMEIGENNFYNFKNAYLFQTPFTKTAYQLIAQKINNLIELISVKRVKVIAVDADNTLWGGIVGEDGIDGICIDENYPGVVYKYFQEFLKYLKNSGIVLALVSKNNENDVKEVFERKNMPLKWDDFILHRVNWNPKSESLQEIAGIINVSNDAVLFVDDNLYEIEEVQRFGFKTFHFDTEDLLRTVKKFENLNDIKALSITDEDLKKNEMYKANMKRSELLKEISNMDDFLRNLEMEIKVSKNDKSHLKRITQLINKTNQFNLTTKRYSESEVEEMMEKYEVYDFALKDKYGDLGIIGVVIVKDNLIDTFLLSCRALGRKVEEFMLDKVKRENLIGIYIPSKKNHQTKDFYKNKSKKIEHKENMTYFYLDENKIKKPDFIKEV
ncbi:MAG: HAD-IIIC family phosphatase [Nautiliaceae bacterium]